MSKGLFLITFVLACLLGVQTYRVGALKARTDTLLADYAETAPVSAAETQARQGENGVAVGDASVASSDDPEFDPRDELNSDELAEDWFSATSDDPDAAGDAAADAAGGGSRGKSQDADADKDDADEAKRKAAAAKQCARLVKQARDASLKGDYENAMNLLKQALEADPASRDAHQQLAKLYHTLGMTDDELALYQDWISQRPNDAAPYYQQAKLLESLGRDAEAAESLRTFQQMAKGEVGAYSMEAALYRKLGMTAEERAALNAWVGAAPGSIDAHRALAQSYARNNERVAALAEYQWISQAAPANADAHVDLGNAYQRLRQFDNAQAEFAAAMNIEPADMGIRLQLAQTYKQSGDVSAALETYYGVVSAAPNTIEALRAQRAINKIERNLQRANKG